MVGRVLLSGARAMMLIAVGMYLPIQTTSAIFVGGLMRWGMDKILERRKATAERKQEAENAGTLLASGFIAGEALCGVLLSAFALSPSFVSVGKWVTGLDSFAFVEPLGGWLSLLIFAGIGYALIAIPLRNRKA